MSGGAGSLELVGLSKSYGSVRAVDGLSLAVPPGGFTTLLGPSGCGKTTALRMIAGFVEPDAGDILINGRSQLGRPAFRRDTAMVFQDFALFPHMAVAANVGYGLRHRRLNPAERTKRVEETLQLLRLDGLAQRFPHELSGGQQQRVALGRALAVRPQVLLMDEPLSNLDAKLRVHLRSELGAIQRRLGITTVHVTHDQEEALSLSDHVAVMTEGRLRQAGTPRELYELPRDRFVADVVGEANYLAVSDVVRPSDGVATVTVAGQRLGVRDATGGAAGEVLLLVRPEWFLLEAGGRSVANEAGAASGSGGDGSDASLGARLVERAYHGAGERLSFRLDASGESVAVAVAALHAPAAAAGDELLLRLPPGRAVLVLAA